MNTLTLITAIGALILGAVIGFGLFKYVLTSMFKNKMEEAEKEAEVIKEKKLLEVKEKFLNKKAELEKEVQQRNQHIVQTENKLKQRELGINQRQEELGRRKQELDSMQGRLKTQEQLLARKEEDLDKMQQREIEKLEELSGLSASEAKERLVEGLKAEAQTHAQSYINEIMDEAKLKPSASSSKPFSVLQRKRPLKIVSPSFILIMTM